MNETTEIANPFGAIEAQETALIQVEQERASQEVQAAMVIAKKFPRDHVIAMDRILKACARPALAELAEYAYPRGGQVISGPSIRLAEAIAQNWGNLQFGVRELSQDHSGSTVESFAWDLETNTRAVKVFHVKHERYSRSGTKTLTDPRDIYEHVANQGARRLRSCILATVPGEVTDVAQRACHVTLANSGGAPDEQIKKLVEAFAEHSVTRDQIVKRLGHHLDSIVMAEVIQLRRIYTSIKDGMSKASDFFEKESGSDSLNESIKKAQTKDKPAQDGSPQPLEQLPITRDEMLIEIQKANNMDELAVAQDLIGEFNSAKDRKILIDAVTAAEAKIGAPTS